jgi:hypothetical protein
MPKKVTAWSCQFKCGAKVQTVRSRMIEHEAKCILNPNTRCCPTCRHNYQEWGWCCDIDKYPKTKYGIKSFVRDCDYWEPKEG